MCDRGWEKRAGKYEWNYLNTDSVYVCISSDSCIENKLYSYLFIYIFIIYFTTTTNTTILL